MTVRPNRYVSYYDASMDNETLDNELANHRTDGLMSKEDKIKLDNIQIDEQNIIISNIRAVNVISDEDNRFVSDEQISTWNESITSIINRISNIESNSLHHLERKQVSSIDEIDVNAENADKYVYLVPNTGQTDDSFDEYMVVNGIIEKIGDWEVDLSEYVKITDLITKLDKKVDKQENARLMLETEGIKLESIQNGAQVNVIDGIDLNQFHINENKTLSLRDIAIDKVTGLKDILDKKVDKIDGKGLSTHDLTDAILEKINKSQENIIEAIQINGIKIPINEKVVNIKNALIDQAGVVKSSIDNNKIFVLEDGTMEVNNINVNKLYQDEGDILILYSGSSE